MARYTRTGYKRYRRRRNALTTRNITARTSARSQSRQLLALRNRINAVARNCRQETQLFTSEGSDTFTNSTFATTNTVHIVTPAGAAIAGQWMRSKGLSIRGVVEYSDNYATDVAVDHQRTCSFRIIVYARIGSGNQSAIPIGNIIDLSASGAGYELNAVRPLKKGLTSYAKIYYDKTYTISAQNPIKRIAISLRKILNLHKETDDAHPRGETHVAFVASGLHFDSTYNQQLKFSYISTYAYNDEK